MSAFAQHQSPSSDDDRENAACLELARDLETNIPAGQILQAAFEHAKEWRGRWKKARRARYKVLANIYEIHVRASKSPSLREEIRGECERRGIRWTKATHRTAVLVKLILDPPPATVSQYSLALREAVIEGIQPSKLAERLSKKGTGIAAMASRFSARHSKKRRTNVLSRSSKETRRGDVDAVSFRWPQSASTFWQSQLPDGGFIDITVVKNDSRTAIVVWAAPRSKQAKLPGT